MEAAAQCPKLSLTHLSFKRDMILISINQATNQAINQSVRMVENCFHQCRFGKLLHTFLGTSQCQWAPLDFIFKEQNYTHLPSLDFSLVLAFGSGKNRSSFVC